MTVIKAKAMFPNADETEYDEYHLVTESDVVKMSNNAALPESVDNVQKAIEFLHTRNTLIESKMTLNASGWSGATAPFIYNLSVSAQTGERFFLIDLTITNDQLKQLQLANIVDGGNGNNTVIFKAYGQKPTVNIPIRCIFIEKDKNINNINFGGNTISAVPLATKSTPGQFDYTAATPSATNRLNYGGQFYATKVFAAVYNDYAEYREAVEEYEAGTVVVTNKEGKMEKSNGRLQPLGRVVSDTAGQIIGASIAEWAQPSAIIGVSGRVLVKLDEEPNNEKMIGTPLCTGENGCASLMTREEVQKYPDRIIGIYALAPKEETIWDGDIEVNNRVWMEIK